MFYLALALVLGISFHHFYSGFAQYILYTISGVGLLLVLTKRSTIHYYVRSCAVLILLIMLGYYLSSVHDQSHLLRKIPQHVTSEYHQYQGIIDHISSSDKYLNLTIILTNISANQEVRLPRQKVLLKIKHQNTKEKHQLGQIISFSTKWIDPSTDPSNGYYQYLVSAGYYYVGYTTSKYIDYVGSSTSLITFIGYRLRSTCLNIVSTYINNERYQSILKALLLGYKSELDAETKLAFINSGTMHILAVSGLHVGIVAKLIDLFLKLLSFFTFVDRQNRFGILTIGLIFFASLSGGAPPVCRAVLMAILYYYARTYSKLSFSLNLIALAASLLLLYNPDNLFQIGFQLSFTAVTGIVILFPIFKYWYYPERWLSKNIINIIYMGVAAQISLLPLSLYYFQKVSWLSPFTSIISIPFGFLLLSLGILLLMFGWWSWLGSILGSALEYVLQAFYEVTRWASKLEFGLYHSEGLSLIMSLSLLAIIMTASITLRSQLSKPLI